METIKCKSCGAVQEISNDTTNCSYCGSSIEIKQSQDFYTQTTKSEYGNFLMMAETAEEATNYEEAINYYNKILEKDTTYSDAWLGKGNCIIYTSKIGDIRMKEALTYWKNALKHSANQDAMSKRVAKEINTVVKSFYPIIENHFIEYRTLANSYQELVTKFVILEKALAYSIQLDNDNIMYFETGHDLCKRVIQIPINYASSDSAGALVEGIVGAVQQNKYTVANADKSRKSAIDRKNEIKRASTIVFQLEEKYVNGIKRIDPNSTVVLSSQIDKQAKEKKKREVSDAFKESFFKGLGTWFKNQPKFVQVLLIIAVLYIIAAIFGGVEN